MKKTILSLLCVMILSQIGMAQKDSDVFGRWDLTVQVADQELPSWLEVSKSGTNTLVGQFVAASGSARPIAEITKEGKTYAFSIPKQWEPAGQDMSFTFQVNKDQISGEMTSTNGKTYAFSGVRAPKFEYTYNPTWGSPINLFNGNDLSGWHHSGETKQWQAKDGILVNPESGSNLITDEKFKDFKLHIEFRYPEGSNSGLYLRGRHEVQIADNRGMEPSNILFGGIYGFLTPTEMMAKKPGEWQYFDITLIGNRVTIEANGKPIIIDQAIPGITGGALDSQEGEPGPFLLQGDHGPVEFRNIVLIPRID
ncbi:MAG TPA: DUF1080 domain-containing protein [Saprospiraceae bacterium]|nr:DUF1080 domain-containing protein [Saprospiraceae bacterium]